MHDAQASALQNTADQLRKDAKKLVDEKTPKDSGLASDGLDGKTSSPGQRDGGGADKTALGSNGTDQAPGEAPDASRGFTSPQNTVQLDANRKPSDPTSPDILRLDNGFANVAIAGSGSLDGPGAGRPGLSNEVVDLRTMGAASDSAGERGESRNAGAETYAGAGSGGFGDSASGQGTGASAGGADAASNRPLALSGAGAPPDAERAPSSVGDAHGGDDPQASARAAALLASNAVENKERLGKPGKSTGAFTFSSQAAETGSELGLFRQLLAEHAGLSLLLLLLALWLGWRATRERSKPRKLALFAASVVLLLVFAGGSPPSAEATETQAPPKNEMKIYTDEKIALAAARVEGRPVLIDFGAQWCAACQNFEGQVLTDPAVKEKLSRFVVLKLDVTEQNKVDLARMHSYGVDALPALVFLNKQGQLTEQSKVLGVVSKQRLLPILEEW